ncbi:MAG: L-iditol 2-dehydrogenase [Thaumarchaeota archaeon]|nr:MAG: L-iditol 2-dehydrogenase [Nitrososphaerota archaeon]
MKAAVVKSNSNIEIKNMENQSVGPGDILVKMRACGICGSDVEKVFGKYGQPSMRLGHEPAGIIMEVGSEISNFSVGDRVFTHHHVACYSDDCHECNHGNETMCKKYYESNLEPCGLADEYIVPEWNVKHGGVLKIPDSMSFEDAAMIEPLACCIRAWNKFTHKNNDSIAILGIGPTGIMHALLAKIYGFEKIFCLDFNEFRLDFAKKFEAIAINSGNTNALEQIKSETANQGVDVVIVATSSLNALKDAVNFVRKGGTIVMFGVPSKGAIIDLDMSEIYSKGITIVNSYAASDFDTKEALEKISNKQINVSQLITHKYNLRDNAMKIIISN